MASLSLKHIYKVYDGGVKAVNDFCMEIEDKEFIVFVGPSGCGKSTTLRMIAGLEDITAGELRIDNEIVNDFEPKDRNIAMVFQNYALYPHMTVYENMAFSLKTARMPNDVIHAKVTEAAEILGITEYLGRKPKALSGGQRQRVALRRGIVRNPKVFLLDEPLSNLDAKLRAAMRAEISRLHERLGTTFIYVTHDQVEAMTMGTRIVVMKDGFVQQIDTPINLYKYPDNIFVAGFIGTPQMNFFDGTMVKQGDKVTFRLDCGTDITMDYIQADKIPLKYMDGDKKIVFGIRPDGVRLGKAEDDSLWAGAKAIVSVVEVLGGETLVYANLNVNTPDEAEGQIIIKADPDCVVHRGDVVDISISKKKFHVFDKETEKSIRRRLPEENIVKCSVKGSRLSFGGQSFALPTAIAAKDSDSAELVMPVSAVSLGKGEGKATLQWTEDIEGKTLYFLKVGELTLFAAEEGEARFKVGDELAFDVDMCAIRVDSCGIAPMALVNTVDGVFSKEKNGKQYRFFMEMAGGRLLPDPDVCRKLFACKGTKIFKTDIQYVFDAAAVSVVDKAVEYATLSGTVSEVLDYGYIKYAKVSVGGELITVAYDGKAGDSVNLRIDPARITVKDRKLDIIIV